MRLVSEILLARARKMLASIRDRIQCEPDGHEFALKTLEAEVAALERRIETLARKQTALAARLDSLA